MYANVENLVNINNSNVQYITCPTDLHKQDKKHVREFFKSVSVNKNTDIKIDMSALKKIDLWGAGLLVKNIKRLKSNSTPVSLYSDNTNSIFILDTLKISDIVDIDLINDVNGLQNEVVYN